MHTNIIKLKVLPIFLINPYLDEEESIAKGEELESLIATLGADIVDRIIQRSARPNSYSYIGRGKVEEVVRKLQEIHVDVVVLNEMVKPRQIHALKKEFEKVSPKIQVWDRVDLILHIFEKHAATVEAKLQIELARMNYMGPRIYGMGHVMSQQAGGIGTVGVGETNTELMKRHWRSEKKKITDQLEKVNKNRMLQLERRKRANFKTVSIVGYTNAGKSSLFNSLTSKNALAEDVLFATLDSSIGQMYLEGVNSKLLVTDTIGFIRDLPPLLISAFKSTLMDSMNADLILHLIDASDPEVERKMEVVSDILEELGIKFANVIYVFNKIDNIDASTKETLMKKYENLSPIFISVKKNQGIQDLKNAIKSRLLHKNSHLSAIEAVEY